MEIEPCDDNAGLSLLAALFVNTEVTEVKINGGSVRIIIADAINYIMAHKRNNRESIPQERAARIVYFDRVLNEFLATRTGNYNLSKYGRIYKAGIPSPRLGLTRLRNQRPHLPRRRIYRVLVQIHLLRLHGMNPAFLKTLGLSCKMDGRALTSRCLSAVNSRFCFGSQHKEIVSKYDA